MRAEACVWGFVDKGDATFAPKGWIGQHDIKILAWMATQAIDNMHRLFALFIAADAMQEELHHA